MYILYVLRNTVSKLHYVLIKTTSCVCVLYSPCQRNLLVLEPMRQAFPFIQEMLTGVPLKLGKSQVRLTGGEQAGN